MIENYTNDDLGWVEVIFKQNSSLLGNFFWMKQALERGHKMLVIREKAFCRYHWDKKKTANVIDEIAVHRDHQRHGLASEIIKAIETPIWLKTDVDNVKSNAFYKREGFKLLGQSSGKTKLFNIWCKF